MLQPGPADPMSAAKSHACRPQLRTVTAGWVTLQVTEQTLLVPGCFLGSLAMMVLVMSSIHCSQWPSSSPTAAQDNAHRAGDLGMQGRNKFFCLFLPCTCGHLLAMQLIYLRACALSLYVAEASAQAGQIWMVAILFLVII